MAKELLLYGGMYSWNITDFIKEMEAMKNSDIVLRVNTNGGDVKDSWGAVAKFAEHPKGKKVKVDGSADSMGLYFLCYTNDVECLDTSTFLLHRAGYSSYWETNDRLSAEEWASLNATNAKLRAALEAKINVAKFTALKNVTLDQVFSNEGRLDVELNAEEALAIGLVNKINTITPGVRAQIDGYMQRMAASNKPGIFAIADEPNPIQQQNNDTMTAAEFKAKYPQAHAEIFNEGVTAERDRVGSYLAFAHLDIEGVKKGIEGGKAMTDTQRSEFALKVLSAEALKKLQADSAGALTTAEQPVKEKTEEQKNLEAASKKLDELLGLDKK